jgi:pyruvate dehydrogenase E2 component (dihydrolipoamide acetyltransferase)
MMLDDRVAIVTGAGQGIGKATAIALKRHGGINASWTEDAIRRHRDVDISIAVATPGGLMTPILRNADQKSLACISSETRDLAARAKDGKLRPEEFQGGGTSISNLGMYGISEFAAIVNPPQACILAVGACEQRALVRDGEVRIGSQMSCTLSVDHRVVDGALGAEFLREFRKIIETPFSMLV